MICQDPAVGFALLMFEVDCSTGRVMPGVTTEAK